MWLLLTDTTVCSNSSFRLSGINPNQKKVFCALPSCLPLIQMKTNEYNKLRVYIYLHELVTWPQIQSDQRNLMMRFWSSQPNTYLTSWCMTICKILRDCCTQHPIWNGCSDFRGEEQLASVFGRQRWRWFLLWVTKYVRWASQKHFILPPGD